MGFKDEQSRVMSLLGQHSQALLPTAQNSHFINQSTLLIQIMSRPITDQNPKSCVSRFLSVSFENVIFEDLKIKHSLFGRYADLFERAAEFIRLTSVA